MYLVDKDTWVAEFEVTNEDLEISLNVLDENAVSITFVS
jgi:hypothetical protein